MFQHMLTDLRVVNLPTETTIPFSNGGDVFVLSTCQRTLIITFNPTYLKLLLPLTSESWQGEQAYNYLLEVLCGLQSKVLAENEIVGQFKKAYSEYIEQKPRNSLLMKTLEKLFKDGKEIRTRYLLGIGQKTYAGIVRKILCQNQQAEEILIMGTGQLAVDLINQLKKKCKLYLSGRNREKLLALSQEHELTTLPWQDIEAYAFFPHIVNTIGTTDILFNHHFFSHWISHHDETRLFVDLGSPSPLQTSYKKEKGIIRLDHILSEGVIKDQEKLKKVHLARQSILNLTQKRMQHFNFSLTKSEVAFA